MTRHVNGIVMNFQPGLVNRDISYVELHVTECVNLVDTDTGT